MPDAVDEGKVPRMEGNGGGRVLCARIREGVGAASSVHVSEAASRIDLRATVDQRLFGIKEGDERTLSPGSEYSHPDRILRLSS
jgi:hypothetical protein